MDEKQEQTLVMLNDENHPQRTRPNDNRSPVTKVILLIIKNLFFHRKIIV